MEVDAIAGESQTVQVPPPAPAPAIAKKSNPHAPSAPPDEGMSPLWIAVPAGLTVGFFVTSLVAGARSNAIESDLEALQAAGNPNPDDPRAFEQSQQELVDDGESWSTVSNVFLGVAGAAAAATVVVTVLVVTGDDTETPVTALLAPRLGGATAGLSIAF